MPGPLGGRQAPAERRLFAPHEAPDRCREAGGHGPVAVPAPGARAKPSANGRAPLMDALPLPLLQGPPVIDQLIDPADAARHAYGARFRALEDSGCPHPLRLWNYLPRINADGGGLALRFLAGTVAPRPLENPRQVPAWRYSRRFGPRSPTFSRAALALLGDGRVALRVSGTAPGGLA